MNFSTRWWRIVRRPELVLGSRLEVGVGVLCQRRSAVFSCSKASGRGLVTESAAPMT